MERKILIATKNQRVCGRIMKPTVIFIQMKNFSQKLNWKKTGLLLKEGVIGVLATDTLYGICGPALNKKTVEKIYKLRKRNPKKPMIVLISSFNDLKKFKVKLKKWQKEILEKIWPSRISVILPCFSEKFSYLHRGTKTIAFRFPAKKELLKILSISGPLAAPSANWEGYKPAKNISEAGKYFGNRVFYHDAGKLEGKPSTLIDITRKPIKILRPGADYPTNIIKKSPIRLSA